MVDPILYSFVPLMEAAEISSLRGRPAAIPALNVNFYAQAEGILEGLRQAESPGIIQASKGACKFQGGADRIQYMLLKAMTNLRYDLPVVLHLDHGDGKSARDCIDKKFSCVMIDLSKLPELENIAGTREIVEYAHKIGVGVEAEYGLLSGVEEDVSHQKTVYADPKFVPVFFDRSKADALAIAYGTSHGPNKGKTEALNTTIVRDSYAGLKAYHMNLNHFLVSHGSSTVPQELIKEINSLGGELTEAHGVPEYKLREAIEYGIRKINIDTDLRLGITATFRKYFKDNPGVENRSEVFRLVKEVFDGKLEKRNDKGEIVNSRGKIVDPRDYLQPVVDTMPSLLRENYRDSTDEDFVIVMGQIKDRVANHVAMLSRMFGSKGLASKVDRTATLEEIAKMHSSQ